MTQTTVAPEESSDGEQPHRRRRWPWVVALVGGVVIVGVVLVLVLFVFRENPGARPLGEAVEEFRRDGGPQTTSPEVHRPAAGVYAAAGEGHEAISFPPISQNDGATMPVTVQYEPDGCWTFKVDFNEVHWQSWHYCQGAETGSVIEQGGQTFQRWDLGATSVENTSTFTCDPSTLVLVPDAVAGTTWDQTCRGTNAQVSGTTLTTGAYTFVGEERLLIGDEEVSTHHYRQARTITGAQTGEQTVDLWIELDSGLPVRSERSFQVDSSSPVGTIEYTENGWWQLSSRRPST